MENFVNEYAWIAMGIVMVLEYVIGASKLKSNSTIELVINILKFVFGKKEEVKKLD